MNDTEKLQTLLIMLDKHIQMADRDDALTKYLESIRTFLKTNDGMKQKEFLSNSESFIDSLASNSNEFDFINYLENNIEELEMELKKNGRNEFIKGKVQGIKLALRIIRMQRIANTSNRQGIDIIID